MHIARFLLMIDNKEVNMKFLTPIVILLLVGFDQLTKYWADSYLKTRLTDIELWPGVFHLTYVENPGAAFGMMKGQQTFFIVITVVVLVAICWYWRQIPSNKLGVWMKVAILLIVSGAIGNLIDRVLLNYVRDMLYFVLIDFPVFNVADICVVGGVALLFPLLLFADDEPKQPQSIDTED